MLLVICEPGNIRAQGRLCLCYRLTRNSVCALIILKAVDALLNTCVLLDAVIFVGLSLCVILGMKRN